MQRTSYKGLPDEVLIQQYLAGDQYAFQHLVIRYQGRVFGYLMGMVRDESTANDLLQDTWLNVILALNRSRGSYQHSGRFVYWVIQIARNKTRDYFRSKRRWPMNGLDETDYEWLPDEAPLPDEKLLKALDKQAVHQGISRLSQVQREVVHLRLAGLTFDEIARQTGVSINTALGRMRYALLNLRKMLRKSGHLLQAG